MNSFIPKNSFISGNLGRPANHKNVFQEISKDFGVRLPSHPNMLNPVNEMYISIDRIRTIFRNYVLYLTHKITSHKEVVNIFNVNVTEKTCSININSNILEIASGRNPIFYKFPNKGLDLGK